MTLNFTKRTFFVSYEEHDEDTVNLKKHDSISMGSFITGHIPHDVYNSDASIVPVFDGMTHSECANCGKRPEFDLNRTDPSNLFLEAREECSVPDGFTYEVAIDVPSGELVIVDYFGTRPDEDENGHYLSINSLIGQRVCAELLQKQNIAYAQLGNSVYAIHGDVNAEEIHVGSLYDYDQDEIVPPEGHTVFAHLICDVWAVEITDADTYATMPPYRNPEQIKRIKVKPGKYTLTNYTTLTAHSMYGYEPTHAKLTRTGDL